MIFSSLMPRAYGRLFILQDGNSVGFLHSFLPMCPGRTAYYWCRRGESNRRATLKSRKLLILRIARNAKTARNVFHGYAAATRSAARGFRAGRNRGTQKFISDTKTN